MEPGKSAEAVKAATDPFKQLREDCLTKDGYRGYSQLLR